MAESSIYWDTNGTGDGLSGGYTEAQMMQLMRSIFTANATHLGGVAPDFANKLAVTGTATPVAVNTGAALVYGIPYFNTSSVNVAVSTPAGATRIDRVVLRANWTAQTVRIALLAGSEGGAAPALTQSAGTTWEISLAQISITTGGVITVTDERVYLSMVGDLAVTTAKIAADAVTNAKIADDQIDSEHYVDGSIDTAHIADGQITTIKLADLGVTTGKIANLGVTTGKIAANAVDGDKVGDRVPQLYRRQGGSSSEWATAGTTTYTPAAVIAQVGVSTWTGTLFNEGTLAITFPVAFSGTPVVFANLLNSLNESYGFVYCLSVTASGASLKWYTLNGKTSLPIQWLAIGPE